MTEQKLGFYRLKQVLDMIPVSKSSWWANVQAGIFPKPVYLTIRTTAWKAEDIHALCQKLAANDQRSIAANDNQQKREKDDQIKQKPFA